MRKDARKGLALVAAVTALAACHRTNDAPAPPDAAAAASAAASASAAATATASASASASAAATEPAPDPALRDDLSVPAAEAKRATLRRLEEDPSLDQHRDALFEHFGKTLPSPLEVQTIDLPAGRRAMLVMGPPSARDPLVLAVDAHGTRPWIKEHPVAGIFPGLRELALVRGAEGGVSLALHEPQSHVVALRQWHADGGVLADYQLFTADTCDALAALFWPGHGTVVAASDGHAARAQLLTGEGQNAWGPSGLRLPWTPAAGAPIALAADTETTLIVLQTGTPDNPGDDRGPPAVLAMRYGPRGTALWPAPVAVGRSSGPASARIVATPVAVGTLRVELPGTPGKLLVELSAEGRVVVLPQGKR
jgi:hypothetical protein